MLMTNMHNHDAIKYGLIVFANKIGHLDWVYNYEWNVFWWIIATA